MNKKPVAFRSILNPKPPLLVSCRGKDGKIDWSRIDLLKF